jgi:hypothetical protein
LNPTVVAGLQWHLLNTRLRKTLVADVRTIWKCSFIWCRLQLKQMAGGERGYYVARGCATGSVLSDSSY